MIIYKNKITFTSISIEIMLLYYVYAKVLKEHIKYFKVCKLISKKVTLIFIRMICYFNYSITILNFTHKLYFSLSIQLNDKC